MKNTTKYGAQVFTYSNGKNNQSIDEVHIGYMDSQGNMSGAEISYYADEGITFDLNQLDDVSEWLENNNYKLIDSRFDEAKSAS